jgi:hypothetical protein
MPEPWERLDGESVQAFEGFALYRDMGVERSLAKVAARLGKSKALMDRWSARDRWVARADSWDVEADRLHRAYLIAHRRDVDRRLLGIAGAMQAKMVDAPIRRTRTSGAPTPNPSRRRHPRRRGRSGLRRRRTSERLRH